MGYNIELDLLTQTTETSKNLNKVIKQLKEIDELSNVEVKIDKKQIDKVKKAYAKVNKEKEKGTDEEKKAVELLKLKGKMIDAQKAGYDKLYKRAKHLYTERKKGAELTKQEWEQLRLINKQEQARMRINKDVTKIRQKVKLGKQKEETRELKDLENQRYLIAKKLIKYQGNEHYDKLSKTLKKYQKNIKDGNKLNKKQLNNLKLTEAQLKHTEKSASNLNDTFGNVANIATYTAMLHNMYQVTARLMNELKQLDDPVYNLGVVAGKTVPQIEAMRTELLGISSTVPQSAEDIAKSLDLIVRTGRSLDESMKIVESSMRLATASGKNLCPSKTSLIMGKSLKILNTKLRQECA